MAKKFSWKNWKPKAKEAKKEVVKVKNIGIVEDKNKFNANKDIREQMWDFLNPLQK